MIVSRVLLARHWQTIWLCGSWIKTITRFSGSTVTFSTTGGTLSETSVVTGADGQASTALTLPAAEGDYTVTASVSGLADVTFSATATAALTVAGEPENAEVDPSATTAVATWEAPLDDGGDPVTGYRLTLGIATHRSTLAMC